ncbi:MAG: 4-(cytidine 5'-diphospho)-2-C-methyl-D-erythritol kinase [Alphaproteobacteria bacterium]|nr:4-(cytidine 5'-diphospho)-2-C-methyl-D-erythritol kinase [Marinicaulis sp.]NOX95239.1 4-(cytidine 5'-diphospho)-2-C-methyl-D-erythritol kinase [Alphaproteobacteria bacterium]
MITEIAPAKINLYLHVGGLRDDGLHDLASLFVFTCNGDNISVTPSDVLSLSVGGAFAGGLNDLPPEKNLIWQAAALLQKEFSIARGAEILLEKNLPIAAGIGGGSADAAAAIRALIKLWNVEITDAALSRLAFKLGADVPACLKGAPVNVTGAGEETSPGPTLPPLWACIVNPHVDMPTGPVFRAFDAATPSPSPPLLEALCGDDYDAVAALMRDTRNDLEPMARVIAPEIGATLAFLGQQSGAIAARMSGSGATCFALFSTLDAAKRTQNYARNKGWWALASPLSIR